jgi:membrane fusion protein, multidrug efflux system
LKDNAMKRNKTASFALIIAILGTTLALSCRPGDPSNRIRKLEKQRDALTQEIDQLKARLSGPQTTSGRTAEAPIPVRVETVAPSVFRHFITVQGVVESDANILVPPLSPGLVKTIRVKTGDRVAKGRILAELDAAVLESGIAEVEHGLALAETIYERRARLWEKKIGSEIEYLQAKNNKEGLEKKLGTLREQLNLTRITAPIDGVVDEIMIKEGEMAPAGFGAFRIVRMSGLKVKASLSENYVGRVLRGDPVGISIPVLGREFEGRIDTVSQVIDARNRTFHVEVPLPSGEPGIKPNMLAVLTINDYTNPDALTIPRNVVQETGAERFLFIAVDEGGRMNAVKRTVRIGQTYDNRVEILEGLTSGDRVVTFGFQLVADGRPIAVDGDSR